MRSFSFFGFSSIYVIFKERADFYDSRSRILEKLNSLPPGTLPQGVQASLGVDAVTCSRHSLRHGVVRELLKVSP